MDQPAAGVHGELVLVRRSTFCGGASHHGAAA
jgi:hypothetical protein